MTTTMTYTNLPVAEDHEAAEADIYRIKDLAFWTSLDQKTALYPRTVTGNTTLALSDHGKCIYVEPSPAADVTITLPQNSTADLPDGFQCMIVRVTTGTVTIAKEGSDTLNTANSYTKIATQKGAVVVTKRTNGEWWAHGDLGA
jgi:hypothetical protein